MSSALPVRLILFKARSWGLAVAALTLLTACGQRGPLYIPQTPQAAQRATLPQTVWGGRASPPAVAASAPASAPVPAYRPPPQMLPDLPDIE